MQDARSRLQDAHVFFKTRSQDARTLSRRTCVFQDAFKTKTHMCFSRRRQDAHVFFKTCSRRRTCVFQDAVKTPHMCFSRRAQDATSRRHVFFRDAATCSRRHFKTPCVFQDTCVFQDAQSRRTHASKTHMCTRCQDAARGLKAISVVTRAWLMEVSLQPNDTKP